MTTRFLTKTELHTIKKALNRAIKWNESLIDAHKGVKNDEHWILQWQKEVHDFNMLIASKMFD